MHAHTIDQVIDNLGQIIEKEMAENSKLAYFPILYRKVTIAVKEGIEKQDFEDNERMEKLDVVFANRYLAAYDRFKTPQVCSSCWQVAFDQGHKFWPLVLQHLLLGINAHINLDLGVAAAEVAGQKIKDLKGDFYKINELLSSMVDDVQKDINKISPIISILDTFAGKLDERLVDFSIQTARDGAWDFALAYAQATVREKEKLIEERDASIAWLGRDLAHPGIPLNLMAGSIKVFEKKKVLTNARILLD